MTTRSSKNLPHSIGPHHQIKISNKNYDAITTHTFPQQETTAPKIDLKTIDYDKITLTTAEQSSRSRKEDRTIIPITYEIRSELKERHPGYDFCGHGKGLEIKNNEIHANCPLIDDSLDPHHNGYCPWNAFQKLGPNFAESECDIARIFYKKEKPIKIEEYVSILKCTIVAELALMGVDAYSLNRNKSKK